MAQPFSFSSLLINNTSFGITGGVIYIGGAALSTVTNNIVYQTGSQVISGSKSFADNMSISGALSVGVINSLGNSGQLQKSGITVFDWFNRNLYDSNNNIIAEFNNRILVDNGGAAAITWAASKALLQNGATMLNWSDQNGPIFKYSNNVPADVGSFTGPNWSLCIDENSNNIVVVARDSFGAVNSGTIGTLGII